MELLSAKEAAKELNISQGTLHRFCRERKIRYTSLNRKEKFYTNSYQKTSEVEEFRSAEIGDRHESLIVPDWKEERKLKKRKKIADNEQGLIYII